MLTRAGLLCFGFLEERFDAEMVSQTPLLPLNRAMLVDNRRGGQRRFCIDMAQQRYRPAE